MAAPEDSFSPVPLQDPDPDPNPNPTLLHVPDPDPPVSPLISPRRPRPRPAMPDVPPELSLLLASPGDPSALSSLRSSLAASPNVSRSVVDALLAAMGSVDGLDEPPDVMVNPHAASLAARLLPSLPSDPSGDAESPRSRMARGLLAVLQACTRNRTMCSESGLLAALMDSVETIYTESCSRDDLMLLLCDCIQILCSHSLTVKDLHSLLSLIKKTLTTEWSTRLMLALEKAVGSKEARGPKCTFEFDGESSGLLGPGESRWPFSNGYAFATWIYIESFEDTLNTATAAAAIAAAAAATSGKSSAMSAAAAASALAGEGTTHMPRLFSFISSDNYGVEAYFHGQFLVVETGGGGGKGRKNSLHFTHSFKPQCWYFVGLEQSCKQGLMGKSESELRLYIDGKLFESRPCEFPRVTKSLAFCCIGTNPPPTMAGLQRRRRQCPLFAEMGPVYIFKEPIGPERMSRLASRGGDTLPSFGSGTGLPWIGFNDNVRSLAEDSLKLDAEIGGSLHLLYHPNLLSGRLCQDASPSGAAGTHRRPAEVLGQVHVAVSVRPVESLWALAYGGPMALLPLTVSNVQMDNLEPLCDDSSLSRATASLAAPVFRIISMAIQHPGNNEELCRTQAPEVLSRILRHLLQKISMLELGKYDGQSDEELVASILSLCQSQKKNHALKVHFFRTLLLDLKLWSFCNYGLQKKLLSSLADMVFTESSAMRDADALHMLLDGCRRCFWVVREADSVDTSSIHKVTRPIGEVNALVDELMVVIELLVGAAASSASAADVHCLISFLVDCPQPNQVARVLLLIYRLVVQPNTSRANTFAQGFISSGGIEALFVLLQREAKTGNHNILETSSLNSTKNVKDSGLETASSKDEATEEQLESSQHMESLSSREDPESDSLCIENVLENDYTLETASNMYEGQEAQQDTPITDESVSHKEGYKPESLSSGNGYQNASLRTDIERQASTFKNQILKNLGGISFKINADSARNNVYNIDNADGVVVGIIKLLGALFTSGHLKFGLNLSSSSLPSTITNSGRSVEDTISGEKVSLLLFALQKAFQAAPQRLMTKNVYRALVGATINVSSTDDDIDFYDSGHRFEHVQLLLVLLRSLPYASRAFQVRAIQDLLFLACSHQENRSSLTLMEEWPEWILEVLISNYEIGANKISDGMTIVEIEDLIHNFLIIMLEHSMRLKDGWKDVEATIHCAEWLSMIGGSSTGEQRVRREDSLPLFKRRLLGGLLDFATRELQVQTQVIAAAAAGVAAEGLSPQEAKTEAEQAAHRSVALAENAIVILMLVEDHLRSRGQLFSTFHMPDGRRSTDTSTSSAVSRTSSIGKMVGDFSDTIGSKSSSVSSDTRGLSLDVLASMADANGKISATVMERLTAAAAAEPYESVRCAFVSYGTCASDLSEGWKYRSRMWYGVGLPSKSAIFGGGGSGWEIWNSVLEKDSNGKWIELPLVKKSVTMLQALLLDECGLGGGLGIGGGSGTGMGGMTALYQLLDSDQPFLCMLRMVLASMREDDNGDDDILMTKITIRDGISEGLNRRTWNMMSTDVNNSRSVRKSHPALLWSVLAPILNMPISETKRQRVLVAVCVLYAEVWHAVGKDRNPIRKQYLEAILPPYIAILRRWRPLLAGIHELTSTDGQNPLIADDRALVADVLPLEAALSMITPGWAAAFASPPAAMALAMMAAGAAGIETSTHTRRNMPGRREASLFDRKTTRAQSFASFPKHPDASNKPPAIPKDQAAAKAIALAAARDLERNAKIGSGRGLSAVAMATSSQRRSSRDIEQSNRWNISEAMATAWAECLQLIDSKFIPSQSNKYVDILVSSFSLAREIQWEEIDRRLRVNASDRSRASSGTRAWRKLVHRLVETTRFFGPFGGHLSDPERVFWKLDFVESSSRMRRCLVRNFKGSDHLGAAADYEDRVVNPKSNEDSEVCNRNNSEASFTANLPSTTSLLMSEAISTKVNENDEQTETDNLDSILDNQQRLSLITDQSLKGPDDARVSRASGDQNFVRSIPTVSLGYLPGETDEKVILEVSSLLVRPLKVVRGTFQVTTMRINFIVDEQNCGNSMRDITAATRVKSNETDKNRSWLVSCLLQMYSRSQGRLSDNE